ncbi:thiamine diphosphokinase [Puniceibacterium sediminis]|uniref:Thiamine diphosphokinase n=1 Tax=Puniceibacterium sediminis TaxID=1608407 RepID=A0A238UXS3_9RHOB|nr:thiamine diphosphokinase [Puniceibacterium sediminis]SNR26089.1 thiamine pyrophosphokinase [Puniceibacterium sediminis]
MKKPIIQTSATVFLIGGAVARQETVIRLAGMVNLIVAADGGADVLRAVGIAPDSVIGDMDSASAETIAALPPGVLYRLDEQDSTDFDKCLRHVTAPLVLGYGFLGSRVDHQLAAMTVLTRYPEKRCILVGEDDVLLLCPPDLRLDLPLGSRISLYPLGPVRGDSEGLQWPISGIAFQPDGRVGTSNVVSGPVRLRFDSAKMLVILPVTALDHLMEALSATPASWPAL